MPAKGGKSASRRRVAAVWRSSDEALGWVRASWVRRTSRNASSSSEATAWRKWRDSSRRDLPSKVIGDGPGKLVSLSVVASSDPAIDRGVPASFDAAQVDPRHAARRELPRFPLRQAARGELVGVLVQVEHRVGDAPGGGRARRASAERAEEGGASHQITWNPPLKP